MRGFFQAAMKWLNSPMTMDDMAVVLFAFSAVLFCITCFATTPEKRRRR